VPGGLDQDPAGEAGAGLGDRAARLALAGLVERGDEPQPGCELTGPSEAGEVADLEVEHERRERLDPAEGAQPGDGRPVLGLTREQGQSLVERGPAGEQAVDRGEHVEVGELGRHVLEALAGEPASVCLRPSATVVDTPIAEQKLRDAVAQAREISPHLLTRASEIASCLEARRGHGDRDERAREQQTYKQLSVFAVGLDPVGSGARRLRRCDDVDVQTTGLRRPLERKPVGPAS